VIGDDRAVAAQSDATRTDPYDITPAAPGGGDRGAGTGGDGSVTAAPEDPYFRAFLRRLEGAVVYPDDLRRDLRSGRVVASFQLAPDGTIRDLRVDVHAPYAELDRALVAALRQLGTLGPVPSRLLRDGAGIRVRVPFTFSNPMIR
jgi:TonB family protein